MFYFAALLHMYMFLLLDIIQSDWTDEGLEMSNYKDEHIYYRITTPMIPKDLTCLL